MIVFFFYFFLIMYHTLSIWLWILFMQRHRQIKERRPNFLLNIFDPETRGVHKLIISLFLTYAWKSVIFWWYFQTFHLKWRWSPAQDLVQNTNNNKKNNLGGLSLHVSLNKYKQCWDVINFYDTTCCCFADYGHGVSKVWCKWSEDKNMIFATTY